jgi:hypothetical protein
VRKVGYTMVEDKEQPLARVERQVQEVKRATVNHRDEIVGPWSELGEAVRLEELEGEVDWLGITDKQKEAVLSREVDFSKITRDQLNNAFERLGSYDLEIDVDERPARRLFDEANYVKAVAKAGRVPFGEQMEQVRPVTRNLIESVTADAWPRAAAIVDFGIDSQQHYEALYYPIRNGEIAPSVLDAAMGNGARLTELTRHAPGNPHKEILFHTSWDELLGREPWQAEQQADSSTVAADTQSDQAAARPRADAGARAQPPHPWPSEIAKANRERQAGRDQAEASSGNGKAKDHDGGHSM